jgi:hypothetical protein
MVIMLIKYCGKTQWTRAGHISSDCCLTRSGTELCGLLGTNQIFLVSESEPNYAQSQMVEPINPIDVFSSVDCLIE